MLIRCSYREVVRWQYYLMLGTIVCLLATGCGVTRPDPADVEPAPGLPPVELATLAPEPAPTETPPQLSPICSPLAEHVISTLLDLYLTQPFILPLGANKETGHHGLDFAYYHGGPSGGHINGTPIQSVLDAVVVGMGYNAVYGYYVITETPFAYLPAELADLYEANTNESLYLLYAHMQSPALQGLEEQVQCAAVLGQVGDSGSRQFLTDPHLHLETRVGAAGQRLTPMAFYVADATEMQREEYMRWRTGDDFRLVDPTILLMYGEQH